MHLESPRKQWMPTQTTPRRHGVAAQRSALPRQKYNYNAAGMSTVIFQGGARRSKQGRTHPACFGPTPPYICVCACMDQMPGIARSRPPFDYRIVDWACDV